MASESDRVKLVFTGMLYGNVWKTLMSPSGPGVVRNIPDRAG
jgi:hypothetical protein